MSTPVRTREWTFGAALSVDEIGEEEKAAVLAVLDKRRVFRYFDEGIEDSEAATLEAFYRDRLGSRHALAVNGGTSALVCALVAAGVGPGDEVIIPAYTYIATASAVLLAGAVPVIVDVDDTLTLDPAAFEQAVTEHTAAVIPVHMRGIPAQMDEIMAVAQSHDLVVIEDVAQANGGTYRGRALGSIGQVGAFSFQQYKLITAGEGGLVVTDDTRLFERAGVYHDCAFAMWGGNDPAETFPGQNYRMSEVSAAIALAQSRRLDSLLERLRAVKTSIVARLDGVAGITLQRVPDPDGDVSYSLIFFLDEDLDVRDFSERLAAEGIPNGTIFNAGFPDRHIFTAWDYVLQKRTATPASNPWQSPHYRGSVEYPADLCERSLNLLGRAIQIGLHQDMDERDTDDIVAAIRKVSSLVRPRPS